MKRSKTALIVVCALALVTAVLAAVVLSSWEKLSERSLLVTFQGEEHLVDLDSPCIYNTRFALHIVSPTN